MSCNPRRPSAEGRSSATTSASFRATVFVVLNLVLGIASARGDDAAHARLLRYPDIHGDVVAFVYASDIWTVAAGGGIARRITSHPGLERFPKFSPDGNWIAFTGQYDGDEQVYVVPSVGGIPKRLTSYPAWGPLAARWGSDNQVVGWTPDGGSVVFRSYRDQKSIVESRLYTVPVSGGLPRALPMPHAGVGVFSPDGRRILYSPQARDFRTWKGYRGGWAQELWIFDPDGETRNVTNYEGTDRDPIWSSRGIFFVSDRDGRLNLYTAGRDGSEIVQLTRHDYDVRWASADMEGNIAYELNGDLREYSADGRDRAISVQVPDDGVHRRPRVIDVQEWIEDFDLSPDGERVAVTARGDVFTIPVGDGISRNLTKSDTHERLAAWSPDGSSVAYVSDASGEEELWISKDSASPSNRQITEGNRRRIYRIQWSPTGDRIAVGDHLGRIHIVEVKNGHSQAIGETGAWYRQDFSWSPDGRFLAFSSLEPTFMSSLFLWSEKHGVVRLTSAMTNEYSPAWHVSGNYLYFLADRGFEPQIGSFEWNYVVDRETSVLGLALRRGLPNPFNENGAPAENSESDVRVEPAGIESRIYRVPLESDNYEQLGLNGDQILLARAGPFYLGRDPATLPQVLAYSISDKELRILADEASGPFTSQDVRGIGDRVDPAETAPSVLVRNRDGDLTVYDIKSGDARKVEIGQLRKRIDPGQEWATVFDEVWRRFRDFFYASNMHGYDWRAIGDAYRELLPYVADRSDLNYLLGEMISELNVGHAYVFGGDTIAPDRRSVPLIGAKFRLDEAADRYRIGKIYAGDNSDVHYRSPLTELGVDVEPGDYVLSINGSALTGSQNPFAVLREQVAGKLEIVVSPTPDPVDGRRVVVDSVDSEQPLIYYEWVGHNREIVDARSGGRIGYLHLPSMGPDGIREFIRSYYGQIRKDGLVVDVRGNLGGNVSQMILERLFRRLYSLGYVKGEKPVRTYPWGVGGARVFSGEIAVIANENTLSDGEAFTWTFQQAGRGPVVGTRTWGGVVGIDDTGSTVDGGGIRVPQFAFADTGGRWVVEGRGVFPDIEVHNTPADALAGRDRQLEAAVDAIEDALDGRNPGRLPEAQAPPNKATD